MRRVSRFSTFVLMAACTTGAAKVQEPLPVPQIPSWVTTPPQEPDALYFVGTASNAESLDEAKTVALNSALLQVSQYIGVKVSGTDKVSESSKELDASIRSKLKTATRAQFSDVEIKDWYVKSSGREVGGVKIQRHEVAVLVRIPKSVLQSERERQNKETAAKLSAAVDFYRRGKEAERSNTNLGATLALYGDALSALKDAGSAHALPGKIDDAQDVLGLVALVQEGERRVRDRLHRVALESVSGVSAGDGLINAISAELTKAGFVVVQNQTAACFTFMVTVEAKPGSRVLGKQCMVVEGNARVRARETGEVILSIPVLAKGFHERQQEAARRAAQEAGSDLGQKLAKELEAWIQRQSTRQDGGEHETK